ncbi:MAG: YcbK family protein, partial [Candidatus Acidiferrales bacterium]
QHMEGHAIDIRVPGVSTAHLRNAALSLHEGGVGYYPVSHFVHVDVGPVRQWTFGRTPRRVYRHRGRVRVGE